MGKNSGFKAQQRAKYVASESAPGEGDQTVDATWHSPEWHAARIASLQVQRMSWEDFKQKKKDSEAMEAQAEMAMRDYRAQLDAERALRLGRVGDKAEKTKDKDKDKDRSKSKKSRRSKSKEKRKKSKDGKKEKRRKEDKKKRSKKRKRSGRSDGDSSSSRSSGSSSSSSSSDDSSSSSSDSEGEAAAKKKAKRSKGPVKLSEYLAAD